MAFILVGTFNAMEKSIKIFEEIKRNDVVKKRSVEPFHQK